MYRWSVANRPSANGTDTTIEMSGGLVIRLRERLGSAVALT